MSVQEQEQEPEQTFEPVFRSHPCIICNDKATRRAPVIDRPWVDKLPVLRWLRKLYNAPPRHTVVTRGPKIFCLTHFALAEQMADNEVSERRYAQAVLNGREFSKVHLFNRGLVDSVRWADRATLAQIRESKK